MTKQPGLNMIKCAIFDVDGTIAESLPLCVEAFRKSVETLACVKLTDKEIMDTFGPSEEGTIAALLPVDKYEEGLRLYLKFYEALHPTMCPSSFPGIRELLRDLVNKGLKLAIVTGKGRKSLDISLRAFGFSQDCFGHIEAGSPHGPNKPEGIRKVLDAFALRPEEAVYVGDSPSDMDSAREVAVPTVAAAWAKTADVEALQQRKPDHLFRTVNALAEWLDEVCG